MPKKKKFNLENVKVESFVTTLSKEQKDDAKGGVTGNPCVTIPPCFESKWPDMPC
jgi:hypothetical protein